MLSRSAGTRVSLSTPEAAFVASSSKWSRIAVCSSSSVGTAGLVACSKNQSVGMTGFAHQDIERRHVVIPFNQGRERAEASQRFSVKRPHLIDHARTMVIDPQGISIGKFADAVASEMNLPDCCGGQLSNVGRGIPF